MNIGFEYVVVRVDLVLDEFDYGDDKVGGVVPAEDVVYVAAVFFFYAPVDFFRVGEQQHYVGVGRYRLAFVGEFEDVQFADVVHCDDEVEALPRLQPAHCLGRGVGAYYRWRIAEVEFVVFLSYLRLDASVLFEYVAVVVVAYQQDTSYPPAHQLCRFYHRCSINVFVGYIFSLYIYLRRLYFRRRIYIFVVGYSSKPSIIAVGRPSEPKAPSL